MHYVAKLTGVKYRMEYVLLVLQLLLGIAVFLLWQWIKQLPASIHKRQEQLFQQQLANDLGDVDEFVE